ncbi:MAG: nucleotide exchange factor GrpE [Chloroflexota bacterium]
MEKPEEKPIKETQESELEILKQALTEARAKAEANLAGWQRAQADFANFRRRTEQERGEVARVANAVLLLKLLTVLDDFERAESAIPEKARDLPWVSGIRLIERNLRQVLEQEGVAPMEAVGKTFDPCLHEAAGCCPGKEGIIVKEIKKGYTIGNKLLRPAAVMVGSGEVAKESEEV